MRFDQIEYKINAYNRLTIKDKKILSLKNLRKRVAKNLQKIEYKQNPL